MSTKAGSILAIFLLACGVSEEGEAPPPAVVPEASISETVPPATVADAAAPAEITDAAAPAPDAEPPPPAAPVDAGASPADRATALQTCLNGCGRDVKCIFACMRDGF